MPGYALAAQGRAGDPGGADDAWIDAIVAAFMRAYGTPGIAVAVVRPGRPAFVRGYGVRTLGRPERVDAHTRFAIASPHQGVHGGRAGAAGG